MRKGKSELEAEKKMGRSELKAKRRWNEAQTQAKKKMVTHHKKSKRNTHWETEARVRQKKQTMEGRIER